MPDIDIDFVDREQALGLFKHIRASRIDEGELARMCLNIIPAYIFTMCP